MIISCAICGIEFETFSRTRQFCSWDCYLKWERYPKRIEKQCPICGLKFAVPQCREGQVYCSHKCSRKGIRKSGKRIGERLAYKRVCQHCDKAFWIEALNRSYKYCSTRCSGDARSQKVAVACKTCGIPVTVKPSKSGRRYCSRECYQRSLEHATRRGHTRGGGGKRPDLDNQYFRSSWEANYARLLNHLMDTYVVREWEFESEVFDLGDERYLPDFKVTSIDGSVKYHEVKGYMTAKAQRKLNKMAVQYPEAPIVLIAPEQYKALEATYSHRLPNWE